jgi:ketosteroid isomerase-like protein
MTGDSEALVRAAYDAYARGDLDAMLAFVDPDLEWTFLDPTFEDPEPQVCRGRLELETVLRRQAERGLRIELEDVNAVGDRVVVVVRTPGVDAFRARTTGDRNYTVVTVRAGRIVALRECTDRTQALEVAGGSEGATGEPR